MSSDVIVTCCSDYEEKPSLISPLYYFESENQNKFIQLDLFSKAKGRLSDRMSFILKGQTGCSLWLCVVKCQFQIWA